MNGQKKTTINIREIMIPAFLAIILFYTVFLGVSGSSEKIFMSGDYSMLQLFTTMFVSILLEAIPFIMLGVLISSIIQVFVSEETIAQLVPKNKILGMSLGIVVGFFFPVCDCAVIPVVRRLMKKGVPTYIAVTFMLSAPLINPVVILATNYAFNNIIPEMLLLRTLLGIGVAVIVASLVHMMSKDGSVLRDEKHHGGECHCHSCEHHHHDHSHHDVHKENKIVQIINHAGQEFFDVGKYLIIGAFLASISQAFLPRDFLLNLGQNKALSVLVMMVFAYAISLCSTSDSFIAKTFVSQFTTSSILAFLILGPMLDIKNTLVLFGNFKRKFVIQLISLIFVVVFIAVYITDMLIAI